MELLATDITHILELVMRHEPVGARHVAQVVGKIISLQRSHGTVVHVMSRSLQHELGMHTLSHGWDTEIKISGTAVEELRFMLNILQENNGQFIFSSITLSKVESLASVN